MINKLNSTSTDYSLSTSGASGASKTNEIQIFKGNTTSKRDVYDISHDLIDCFSHRKFDKAKGVILNEVNASNVAEIWKIYNNLYTKQYTRVNVSIPNKIYENYSTADAKKMLDHLVKIMNQAGKKKGIDMSEHIKLYNEAYSRTPAWYNLIGKVQKACDVENAVIRMGNALL